MMMMKMMMMRMMKMMMMMMMMMMISIINDDDDENEVALKGILMMIVRPAGRLAGRPAPKNNCDDTFSLFSMAHNNYLSPTHSWSELLEHLTHRCTFKSTVCN